MIILKCEDSFEGILTAVFVGWNLVRTDEVSIETKARSNMVLFAQYREVVTDLSKSVRVANGLIKISEKAHYMTYMAAMADSDDKGTAIFGFIRRCFEIGERAVGDLHNRDVATVFELSRNVEREYWHYRGFLRFVKYNHFLLGQYEPDNDIMILMADFFCDRLLQENFVIVDMNRHKAAVHAAGEYFVVCDADTELISELEMSDEERSIKEIFNTFQNTIGIESRRNLKLQQQNMPLRFRKYM